MASRRSAVPSYSASARAPFLTSNTASYKPSINQPQQQSKYVTSAQFEATLAATREIDQSISESKLYHSTNALHSSQADSDKRVASIRSLNRSKQQNAELAQSYEIQNANLQKQAHSLLRQQDAMLAEALETEIKQSINESIDRQRICDSSDEIRSLKAQLAAASINRDRHVQLIDKRNKQSVEAVNDAEFERKTLQARADEQAAIDQSVNQSIKERQQHAQVLAQQMDERAAMKQAAYQQFLADKQVVDDVVARMAAQDEEKRERQRINQSELQASIAVYLQQRAAWREKEKQKVIAELRRIAEYQEEQDRRAAEKAAQSAAKVARDDAIHQSISAELQRRERQRQEMERMLDELHAEEREQEMMKEIEAAEAKAQMMRQAMKRENEAALRLKQQQAEQARQEQATMRARVQAQLEADQKIDMMNDAKRRQAKLRMKEEVDEMMKEKQRQADLVSQQEEQQRAKEQQRKQRELQIIEEERARLLSQLATKLKDYLPKGVVRNQQEWEMVQKGRGL